MRKITNDEIQKAYCFWLRKYDPRRFSKDSTEDRLAPFVELKVKTGTVNEYDMGWLRRIRQGLFLSRTSVAQKLKVSRVAYSKFEANEEDGSISLATLSKAAEALDCELVYAIRPKQKKLTSQIIWEKILPTALQDPWLRVCDQKRRAEALAAVANKTMLKPKFRKQQAWSYRLND